MARETYLRQVALLVRVLPIVAKELVFALKGGTAINLFHRDLPRLSIDIDLTYLPIKDRANSLAEIDEAFDRLTQSIEQQLRGASAQKASGGGDADTRILVRQGGSMVKIELSPVGRSVVHEPVRLEVSEAVQEEFGFAEVQVVSFEDLFAGKLLAALDRQHPRDLFDVKFLYEREGISDELFRTFLVYLTTSSRPLHELLDPNLKGLDRAYEREFLGMTRSSVHLEDLISVRARLIGDIRGRIDEVAAAYLLSVHDGDPHFDLLGLPQALKLPAVRWKLENVHRLISENPDKHATQRQALQDLIMR